jgi:acetyl esterase/lipase
VKKIFRYFRNRHCIILILCILLVISLLSCSKKNLSMNTEGVRTEKNIKFDTVINEDGEETDLYLDIYIPEAGTDVKLKTILWIHGGGFMPGNDKEQEYIVRFANAFTEYGYLCISSDYRVRREPFKNWNETLNDAVLDTLSTLEWIYRNSTDYSMDLDNFIIAGGSAGGFISANLLLKYEDYKNGMEIPDISAFVDLWGTPELYHINKDFPPTIIIHGTLDDSVPYKNSTLLNNRLEMLGIKPELISIENAGHTPVIDQYEENFDPVVMSIKTFLNNVK